MSEHADRRESSTDLPDSASAVPEPYERLLALEQQRRRKRDSLEALLPTIADALDVRVVFPRLSDVIQAVIPHVTVSLALVTPDRLGVKIHVASNYDVGDLPVYRFTTEGETIGSTWRSFVAYDCTVLEEGVLRAQTSRPGISPPVFIELRPGPPWTRMLTDLGVRSLLRVPVRIKGEAIGAISFGSDKPFAYDDDDIVLATRIADHVALAMAHERLAEEARRAAQAQERANLLEQRVHTLVRELESRGSHRALGESARWKEVLTQATKVAAAETTVLITGESGTGKEVVARYIHRGSRRARGAFIALNCAALPEQLLESELFGFERGAFTGAQVSRAGKIEQAAGGVLFLDEVGEMTPSVQAKFLRVLQEREFQRLGGTKVLKADVRLIAATNRDPRLAMERGTLREDLYYRLSVFEIALPPLRDRKEDILLLADAFLKEVGTNVGRPAAGISEDARDQLIRHSWPGNVRELRNAIERAVILCEGGLVSSEHLPIAVAARSRSAHAVAVEPFDDAFPSGGVKLDVIERDFVEKALARARNNKSQAARLLGLPRGQFYSLLRRHGLTDARR
jgi:transcriptional regulator with GAF, ATPase, and Fis domain